jgi:hypothetical protein
MSIEAMKQALEALELLKSSPDIEFGAMAQIKQSSPYASP